MTIYYILLALTALAAYPLCRKGGTKGKIIYIALIFGFMAAMASLRYGIGNDYFHYRDRMLLQLDFHYGFADAFTKLDNEPGYALIVKAVGAVFPRSVQYLALNVIMAVLCILPVSYVIGRYSKMPWLSAWLYICLVFFYNTMNFTRQSLAAAIIFLAYPFMRDKKHIPVILLILLACTFHLSAAVMLPVYLISLIKPHRIFTPVMSACAVGLFIFSKQLIDLAVTKVFTHYTPYLDSVYLNNGLSKAFIIVPAVMLIIVLTAYLCGWRKDSAPLFTNFMLYNFFIWLFSMKHFVVERFSLHMYIFVLLAVPDIICFFAEKYREKGKKTDAGKFTIYLTGAVYLSSLGYNQYCMYSGVHGVFPYKSVFSPAVVDMQRLEDTPRECFVNDSLISFLYTLSLGDYSVFAVNSGSTIGNIELIEQSYFNRLGLTPDLNDKSLRSYIGAASGGSKAFERMDDGRIEETVSLYDGKYTVQLVSDAGEGYASAVVNGREFITQGKGIFFIVFDNKTRTMATAQGYDLMRYTPRYIHSDGFDGVWYVPGFENFEADLG
ncbi:MAG: EpsG family protein [Oscillospiraceae bacterium]|nr:EpsG family protein [Oscillospiraceae bacterium]